MMSEVMDGLRGFAFAFSLVAVPAYLRYIDRQNTACTPQSQLQQPPIHSYNSGMEPAPHSHRPNMKPMLLGALHQPKRKLPFVK